VRKNLPEDKVDPQLWRLMRSLPYTFRPKDLKNWKVTPRVLGHIPGVFANVTIVATDHNRALYIDSNGTPKLGHIQQFTGKDIIYRSLPKVKSPKKPKTITKAQLNAIEKFNRIKLLKTL
jgi:hypothetical protein